jgi:hypothetical protein
MVLLRHWLLLIEVAWTGSGGCRTAVRLVPYRMSDERSTITGTMPAR